MIKKDEYLKPLHARPYTPGEQFTIGDADPPGAPISGNPHRPSQQQGQDTDKAHDNQPRP
jgi:hypothetical protein